MIVGLTGGVGSGKSTVLDVFRQLGWKVISADDIVHNVLRRNRKIGRNIAGVFGSEVLNRDNSVNRSKLGKIVFADSRERKKLEKIVFPVVIARLKEIIQENKGAIVAEIPLLFETGLDKLVDKTVVVYASKRIVAQRLSLRDNISLAAAKRRIEIQLPLMSKKRLADYVIKNELPGDLKSRVKALSDKIKRLKR